MHAGIRPRPLPLPAARVVTATALAFLVGACSLFAPPETTHAPAVVVREPTAPAAPAGGTRAPDAPSVQPAPAPQPPPVAVAPAPPVSTRHVQLLPATGALVAQAHAAAAKGDNLTAMSTLERAVRIEPRNPLVWIEIAKTRLVSGEAQQAEVAARRAVALSEGDLHTSSEAWKQVAAALKAQNKNPEAAAAEARANRPVGNGG